MRRLLAVFLAASMVMPPGTAFAVETAERASLEGIEVGADEVTLKLTTAVKYNTFVTAAPPRLVLEVLNTEASLTGRVFAGKGKVLRRVRAGQFAGEPNPIARIVLDLERPVDYRVAASGSDLVVKLVTGEAAAQAPVQPQPAQAFPASATAATAASEEPVAEMPPVPAPVKAATPGKAAPRTEMSEPFSTDASEEIAEGGATHRGYRSTPTLSYAGPPLGHRRRDLLGSLPRDLVTLDLDDVDVRDALKMLGTRANINLIYGAEVGGTMSVHLEKVPFPEAFNIVLSMNRLVAYQVGDNVLQITTSAALKDARSREVAVTRVFPLNYAKAADIKTALDAVRTAEGRTGATTVDERNNSLIVTESQAGLGVDERLLSELDTRPRQVLIEAKLVEVQLNKDLSLGVQWDYFGMDPSKIGGQQGTNGIGTTMYPMPLPGQTAISKPFDQNLLNVVPNPAAGATGRGTGVNLPADKIFGAFTFSRITSNYFLNATLTAAASEGKVKVLSDPKIAVINGKQANINITTQTPYGTTTVNPTGVTTTNVQYITTGIQLAVKPTINADGRITLEVQPTVSQPSAPISVSGGAGSTAIPVNSRNATTTVVVRDGETIVIGGLITDSLSDTIAKVPLLGDIPILGWLFKKKTVSRTRVELLIFVTTKVLAD
ncbi:MAG: AMIN domain-containing protein [Elusimicrobia bacterium]|nr:AMIN domain-containing protein [Elusimicrobiota bacterium]